MGEEMRADRDALGLCTAMGATAREARKLEAQTLRKVVRAAKRLVAECEYYVPIRLEQGGGKAQHRKGRG